MIKSNNKKIMEVSTNFNRIKLTNHLIGRFYFKKTQNGNLIGEFSNNKSSVNSTESADIIKSGENFVGEYNTTWQEDTLHFYAILTIFYKPSKGNKIYSLIWTSKKGDTMFIGEGFLFDGILMGDYRDFEII